MGIISRVKSYFTHSASPAKEQTAENRDTFCILPWIHVDCFADSAIARVCCISGPVEHNRIPLSYYHHSTAEICNSTFMKEVRRKMIHGERNEACSICYINEENNIQSRRVIQNEKWRNYKLNFAEIIDQTIAQEYAIEVNPHFIQLNLGNLCNLKCRMCHAGNSTVISKDPVQSLWSPPRYPHDRLFWRDNSISLLPKPFISCRYDGFKGVGFYNKTGFASISATGQVTLPVFPDTQLDKLTFELFSYIDISSIEIKCNNKILETVSTTAKEKLKRTVDISSFSGDGQLDITISLSSAMHGQTLQIQRLDVSRQPEARERDDSEIVFCRTGSKKPWQDQEEIILDDFLQNLTHLKELLFTGGEPLLNPVMEQIIDLLIAENRQDDILLVLNTNATYLPERLIEKILQFRRMNLNLSVDAIDSIYEYIRYPAKWKKVKNNIEYLKSRTPQISAVPIIQAYNALNISELCRFFDAMEIEYSLLMMHGPHFLHCGLLPAPIRQLAADRLRDYARGEAPAPKKEYLTNIARTIEGLKVNMDRDQAIDDFMMFTNDMDAVNRQDIRASIPELVDLLEENGYQWSNQRKYADG